MSVSGVSSAGASAASQATQALSLGSHKNTSHKKQSISDVDAQSSSIANTQSSSSSTGRKVNILA